MANQQTIGAAIAIEYAQEERREIIRKVQDAARQAALYHNWGEYNGLCYALSLMMDAESYGAFRRDVDGE